MVTENNHHETWVRLAEYITFTSSSSIYISTYVSASPYSQTFGRLYIFIDLQQILYFTSQKVYLLKE